MVLDASQRSQMLKGLLDPCLLAITAGEPRYGYEIVSALGEAGLVDVAEGSVYPALTRLERAGLLQAERVPSPEGPPRKYYRPTRLGERQLAEWREGWSALATSIDSVLGSSHTDGRRAEDEGRSRRAG
jgi:PadR family transcriptional regulator PadR